MKTKTSLLLVLTAQAFASVVSGCLNDGALHSSGPSAPPPLDISRASLRRAASCEDLSSLLRADARAKMNRRINAEVRAVREGYPNLYYGNVYGPERTPTAMNAGAAGSSSGGGASTSGGAGGASGAAPPAPAPAHSDTETQVAGVDEADIVKADGTRLYVLHGQKLLLVDAWPAPRLGIAGSADIEGEPTEMYVADGKVVVFSNVDGTPIYQAAGQKPRAAYSDATPGYSAAGGAMAMNGGVAPSGRSYAAPLTKVTVLSIAGASAQVTRELYFEGQYLSSRRVGSKLRIVLGGGAHGPNLKYEPANVASDSGDQITAWEALRGQNELAIAATSYGDWVPSTFAKENGTARPSPASCTDFYVPPDGSTDFGMTQVLAMDLNAPADTPRSSTIVGDVATVYGDGESMVLAGNAYVDPWLARQNAYAYNAYAYAGSSGGGTRPAFPVQTMNFTHLHLFDLARDPSQPLYVGTGTVPGSVKDQFALDQKDGRVRVTTTEQRTGPMLSDGRQNEVSHVYVLENQSGLLTIAGDAGEIAPGEQLYSTRYIGDKAYVVTWHVTDPLFVIDLANPRQPRILGELKIPGFSEYMHPLDDTHLLTIGRETDDTGHQHTSNGYWYGIAIQVFDVTDPLAPKLQHKYVYDGGEYATTEAAQNHKAFTYFDDRKLLAFPYVRQYSYGATSPQGPSSTLEVFHVDVATGIRPIGSVDHSSLLGTTPSGTFGYCGGYYDGAVRRGVFFENVVYSISYGGIMASDVGNLAAPVSSLKLAAPVMQGLACGG